LDDAAGAAVASLPPVRLGNFPRRFQAVAHRADRLVINTKAFRDRPIAGARPPAKVFSDQKAYLAAAEVAAIEVEPARMLALFLFGKAVPDNPRPIFDAEFFAKLDAMVPVEHTAELIVFDRNLHAMQGNARLQRRAILGREGRHYLIGRGAGHGVA
jgi:hypothetical protein